MSRTAVQLVRENALAEGARAARSLGFKFGDRLAVDLGCGVGGASLGLVRAGWQVIGVDIKPQPNYPFDFVQADALEFDLHGFGLIHASMPCQRWSKQLRCAPEVRERYPDLVTPLRPRLEAAGDHGALYSMENVEGSPLRNPVMMCSWAFDYEHYRERYFEVNFKVSPPPHRKHVTRASRAGHWEPGTFISVAGHCAPMWLARQVMDIHWTNRDELREAIPPYFTQLIGMQAHVRLADRG